MTAEIKTKIIKLDEGTRKLNIWDTAGQEKYILRNPLYWEGAQAMIIFYDITETNRLKDFARYAFQDFILCMISLFSPSSIGNLSNKYGDMTGTP